MVCVFASGTVKDENAEKYITLAKEMVAETVKEDGCISYELVKRGNLYVFFERWESQAHLDAHRNTPHFKTIIPQLVELRETSNESIVLEKLA